MEALRERFGKYHVLDKIAQGGMAEVYKVKTVGIAGFEKVQALKRILPHSAREGRFIRSFIDEARIAVELTHRNIVQVFDFGKADGELFLAMELIEGKDLRTAMQDGMQRGLAPTPAISAYITSEVASGLDYAHRKTDGYGGALGIVHCDVSPSNVMLSTDGYVKILDFGIARASFASALERRRLRGKPRYMAPEQTYGEPPTAAADVFALGIIAWELFTGRQLFRGTDVKSILDQVRRTTAPRIDSINPAVPAEIVAAIATALSREPVDRGTAADLATACARTALGGGARAVANWLEDLDARPTVTGIPWATENSSMSMPQGRPSMREITASLASAPIPEPGDTQRTPKLDQAGVTFTNPPSITGTTGVREPTELIPRPSFVTLGMSARASRASMTSIDSPLDATSYDDLEVEPDEMPPPLPAGGEVVADEPIDDSPETVITQAPVERRRAVVVAAFASGADAETIRAVTRALGELAYQRGGVVIALDDDALVVAFGLEVAGEDDVAVSQGWAQDAAAMARDYREDQAVVLRIGARTGVATDPGPDGPRVPHEAIEDARARARAATPAGDGARARASETHVTPPSARGKLVGRTVQLAELDVWFQRAVAADRRLAVLVTGAAGTGKTRLVEELLARRQAASANLRPVVVTASPANHLAPFALVIELYQASLGLPPTRGRAARAEVAHRLAQRLAKGGIPPDRVRDVVTDLDRAMELRDGLGVGAPEPADLRPRISAGLATFRAALADRRRPLLIVIEDLHLADAGSIEVLKHVLSLAAAGPELLVLTSRPDTLWRPATDAVIVVGDLVGSELRALVADRLGDAATPGNIAAVLARGGGNPLAVEELARAVRDADASGAVVPATAAEVVSARLDRLPERARTTLRSASVLGDRVRVPLLAELLERGEDLDAELEELVRAGFLVRSERDAASGEGAFEFARDLVHEVVYESLSERARRESHARVGRLLSSRFFAGREEPPAVIAEHLERGGEAAGAAAFYLRAGRLALTASDATTAIRCFTKTLELERALGAAPPTSTSRARRREALAGREEADRQIGDMASHPTDLDELQQLCEGEPARLADVAIRRAQRLLRLGDYTSASVATVVAEDQAVAANDERQRGEALRVRAEILERLGRFDDALAVVSAAREVFHKQRSITDEMAAMVGRGRIHLLRAHYAAARDAYRPVLALIEKTGDPWLERIVTNHSSVIEMCLGNFERAMELVQRSLDLCRRYGDRAHEGDGLSVAGIILLEVGQYERAAAMFAEALDVLSRTASRWSRADCLIYAGTCELRRGRLTGLAMLDEAVAEAKSLGARYVEANALIARADARLVRGELDLALADATAGVVAAGASTLLGYEIQGLARQALAVSRLGNRNAEAGALVHRALLLLEQQVTLEGSEELVLAACVEVLRTAGAGDRANLVQSRGRSSAERKLAALTDPAWRASYAALPEIRLLLS